MSLTVSEMFGRCVIRVGGRGDIGTREEYGYQGLEMLLLSSLLSRHAYASTAYILEV